MVTTIRFLEKSGNQDEPGDWEVLYDISSRFLEPECYAYAIALSRTLGWTICGVMKGDRIEHALLKTSEGFIDYRGIFFAADDVRLGMPFGLGVPYEFRVVYEEDLFATRPVPEHYILSARAVAEALHPEYPWPNPVNRRMRCFADELEALSRKHNIWIRANLPTQPPILSLADGGEVGYDLQVLVGGQQCTLNRRL